MKYLFILSSLFLFACSNPDIKDSETQTDTIESPETENQYDSLKAAAVGADKYGMKTYVFAFLKRGPNPSKDSIEAIRLQSAHMANINRLADEGKLVLAGPFYGNDSLRGIYLFDTKSLDSAKAWTETDPAIQQGSLEMELKLWYGSAALMEVNKIHYEVAKEVI